MRKKLLCTLLLFLMIFMITGCGNSINNKSSSNNNLEEQQEEKKEEEQQEESVKKVYYGFDLEQMKPNKGGQEYNKDAEIEMAVQGKVTARFYGEYIGRSTSYDEDTVYAVKVFNYCKSIASDGKVYQSIGRFKDPNSADVKEVNSVKEAEEISNTFTWSIKLDGHWYIITVAGDKDKTYQSIGVRIVQLASY